MTTKQQVDFKIIISKQFTLKCFIIDSENNQTPITIGNNQKEEYIPTISFYNKRIIVCEEKQPNSIHFIQQWIEKPEDCSKYMIHFNNSEYHILPEVLFAIIISEFKNTMKNKYIINDVIVEIPSRDCVISERIKTSLESIGFKDIYINSFEIDYTGQEEQMKELMELKRNEDKYCQIMEDIKEKEILGKETIEEIERNHHKIIREEEFIEEIQNKMSLEGRRQLKICKLDNYCLFIASRYFETLEDHINLTFTTKRMRGNMEKYHYNPISVNSNTYKYFLMLKLFTCMRKVMNI